MLVLTRKIGQQVLINDGSIQVKVLGINGNDIRIGFIAPQGIDIDREEIYLQKKAHVRQYDEAF
jgi:carbon storage regulator